MSWQPGLERFVESSASSSVTSPQSAIESVSPIPLANPELLRISSLSILFISNFHPMALRMHSIDVD